MTRSAIILTLVVLAMPAAGQWSTNAWPAWDHPRQHDVQIAQVYSGLVERLDVLAALGREPYYPTLTASNRRNPSATLGNFKLATRLLLETGYTYGGEGSDFIDRGEMNTGAEIAWTNLCARQRIPVNYLDYTPYRFIDGLGVFTNDTSVGRPYGWTNAYTVAGGTNFPAGRSTWYSTDYGIGPMTNILAELLYVAVDVTGDVETRSSETNNSLDAESDFIAHVIAQWPSGVTTSTIASPVGLAYRGSLALWYNSSAGWYGHEVRTRSRPAFYSFPTSSSCSVDIYLSANEGVYEGAGTPDLVDIYGVGQTNSVWLHQSWAEASTTNRGGAGEATWIGDIATSPSSDESISSPLTNNIYCQDFYSGGSHIFPYVAYGSQIVYSHAILRFDGPNGFKMK